MTAYICDQKMYNRMLVCANAYFANVNYFNQIKASCAFNSKDKIYINSYQRTKYWQKNYDNVFNMIFHQHEMSTIPSDDEERTLLEWWAYEFGNEYIKIKMGYLGSRVQEVCLIGKANIEYFLPQQFVLENKTTTFKKWKENMPKLEMLARRLTIEERINLYKEEVVIDEEEVVIGKEEVVIGEEEVVIGKEEVVIDEEEVVIVVETIKATIKKLLEEMKMYNKHTNVAANYMLVSVPSKTDGNIPVVA
ncbi:hypothetical protein BH23THE1_BH23THE1_35500 [soil metagenome]